MKLLRLVLFALLAGLPRVQYAQGFVNLNFESANVSSYSPGSSTVPTAVAFPGWTASYYQPGFGNQPVSQVWYDAISIGGGIISINDTNTDFGFVPLQGEFSAYLFGGTLDVSAIISQSGLVPVNSQSIQIEIGNYMAIGSFIVALNGNMIDMIPLATFSTYTLFVGDVSPYANQVATLSITALGVTSGPGPNPVLLDNIQFSTTAVPEPSMFAFAALGGLLLGLRHWRISLKPKP